MKLAEEIIEKFTNQMDSLNVKNDEPLKSANQGIALCSKTLSQLKNTVENREFKSLASEIHFFKTIKSIPMSYLIYFTELRTCELQKPKAGVRYQINFLEKELKKINKFFYRNSDFVYYMELGHTYLDHQFFARKNSPDFPVSPLGNYYQFPDFSTSHDLLWSKVKGMNKLIHYIRKTMERIQPEKPKVKDSSKNRILEWTAPKTALIELIYALYSVNSINHGGADLRMITASFEDLFNVKLNQVYKTYSEMKERRGSQTKFLDELSMHLKHKMDKEDH